MKIRPSRFCMPVPNGCTALRREAVFKKSPTCGTRSARPSAAPFKAGRQAKVRGPNLAGRRVEFISRSQRVSVTGAGENVSDGEGVGVMFFLMRYQIVIATRREINFARQFCSVSLIETPKRLPAWAAYYKCRFRSCKFRARKRSTFRQFLRCKLRRRSILGQRNSLRPGKRVGVENDYKGHLSS
jgi:hypothetical protein